MRTEEYINKAVGKLEADKVFDNPYSVPLKEMQFYMVSWIKQNVLDSPEFKGKKFFYCTGHEKGYMQDILLGEQGLGCDTCHAQNLEFNK